LKVVGGWEKRENHEKKKPLFAKKPQNGKGGTRENWPGGGGVQGAWAKRPPKEEKARAGVQESPGITGLQRCP